MLSDWIYIQSMDILMPSDLNLFSKLLHIQYVLIAMFCPCLPLMCYARPILLWAKIFFFNGSLASFPYSLPLFGMTCSFSIGVNHGVLTIISPLQLFIFLNPQASSIWLHQYRFTLCTLVCIPIFVHYWCSLWIYCLLSCVGCYSHSYTCLLLALVAFYVAIFNYF